MRPEQAERIAQRIVEYWYDGSDADFEEPEALHVCILRVLLEEPEATPDRPTGPTREQIARTLLAVRYPNLDPDASFLDSPEALWTGWLPAADAILALVPDRPPRRQHSGIWCPGCRVWMRGHEAGCPGVSVDDARLLADFRWLAGQVSYTHRGEFHGTDCESEVEAHGHTACACTHRWREHVAPWLAPPEAK